MAHEPELLPGRDSLLVECGRALREASPVWAESLMRELELFLQPYFMGMHRTRTACECGETILVRRDDGTRLPPRVDGPPLLKELQRALAQTHGERQAELFAQVTQMASMPVLYPTAQEAGDEPLPLGVDAHEPSRCPWCGAQCRVVNEFYCPPCGMG